MSSVKTYRHDVTGLEGEFDECVAAVDPHLVEVLDTSLDSPLAVDASAPGDSTPDAPLVAGPVPDEKVI